MELQNFINLNSNWLDIVRENGFKIRKFNKYNCVLITHHYDKPPLFNNENEYWKMYCRGAIINIKTNKVICLPPVKSQEIDFEGVKSYYNTSSELQYLIDGTMINLMNINNEWILSTRSEIGGFNKWKNKKSFKTMFNECIHFDLNELNKEYSYSFVMRHKDNQNISLITTNEAYLVEIYDFSNNTIKRLSLSEYPSNLLKIENNNNYDFNMDKHLYNFDDFNFKGITIKDGNKRYKLVNPVFDKVSKLVVHSNNNFIDYLELRKNNNLNEYLKHFPNKSGEFNKYRDKLHELTNDLYSKYKNVFIFKKEEKKKIPYYLKPLIHDIHGIYLSTGIPLSFHKVRDYIYNLPSKKIIFAIQNK
tara:strand:- start:50 stop:1132 length:1083 start_codon:yes stop_codon:yes gene_type:complete